MTACNGFEIYIDCIIYYNYDIHFNNGTTITITVVYMHEYYYNNGITLLILL